MQVEWRQKVPINTYADDESVIEKLIAINGIEDVFRFISPTEEELHDPYLLKNIEAVRDRIVQAIDKKENITISLDVDVDGINSGAIMYHYLKNFTNRTKLIYNQRSQGHGIAYTLDIIPVETDLLIILDSSSNEVDACRIIRNMGIDILIIDHHTVTEENEYVTLVNPQQEDCKYPNKQSSGSLLSWKVCQTLDDFYHESFSDDLLEYAAFGLYGDMMNVGVGNLENRFLVNAFLNNVQSAGIQALLKVTGKEKEKLSGTTIGYNLAPFINAATRLDRLELALELLISDDPSEALEIANEMVKMNEERKKKQKEAVTELKQQVNESDKCMVLLTSGLGKGYNGLVANDLAKFYQRPVIVLGEVDDEYHGSFRSYGGFDFLSFVSGLDIVINAGGHNEAGGVKIRKSDIDSFRLILNEKLKNLSFDKYIEYDFELGVDDINERFVTQVQNFYRVSGTGFEEAKFLIRNLVINQKKVVGSGDTLRLGCLIESDTWFMDAEDIENAKPKMLLMKFKADEGFIEGINVGDKVDVIGSLNLNIWTKYKPKYEIVKTLQLFIEDYRVL